MGKVLPYGNLLPFYARDPISAEALQLLANKC
jgi:hypothetical protein